MYFIMCVNKLLPVRRSGRSGMSIYGTLNYAEMSLKVNIHLKIVMSYDNSMSSREAKQSHTSLARSI